MISEVDPAKCPLCGEPNACARVLCHNQCECWCARQSFPRELLDRVPAEAKDRACICAACLRKCVAASAE